MIFSSTLVFISQHGEKQAGAEQRRVTGLKMTERDK